MTWLILKEIQWWYYIVMGVLLSLWLFVLYPYNNRQHIREKGYPLNVFSFMFWRSGKGPDYLNFFAWGIFSYRLIQLVVTLIVKGAN